MTKQKMKKAPLSETHPEISKQWHPTKNDDFKPQDFTYGSRRDIVWLCEKGHEYVARISHRTLSESKCPFCYGRKISKERSLAIMRPDLAKEFHPTKNAPLDPSNIFSSSSEVVFWICSIDSEHEWPSTVDNRNKGNGCPYCANRRGKIGKGRSLGDLYKHLVDEWDYNKNNGSPYDYAPFSNDKVSWICTVNNGHSWLASIAHRAGGTRCPICSGNKVSNSTSLSQTYPEIVAEWHFIKNVNLLPSDVTAGSNKKVWWHCLKDSTHEWLSSPWNRTAGNQGCPFCANGWSIERIRLFIISLLPYLNTFDQAELYTISRQNGVLDSQGKGRSFIKNFVSGKFPKEELETIADDPIKFAEFVEAQRELPIEDGELQAIGESDFLIEDKDLPITETKDVLASLDNKIMASADSATVEFLIKSAVAKIWRHAFHDEGQAQIQHEQYNSDGEYPKEVKRLFLEGYLGAKELKIPEGYNPNPPGNLPREEELGLMQRYVAYEIKTRKRFGNWSGTGAGKTLSAILTSRVIVSKLTVICCPNNVIDTWKYQIKGSYPDSVIYTKESILLLSDKDDVYKYLILNYDFFQQPASGTKLKSLIQSCGIDLIVIDEIHHSKQRKPNNASKRKTLLSALLAEASNKNSNLSVLGMSATPVINELYEGKTLLGLITGVCCDDLDTKLSVQNCMALYKKFVTHGIRYIPNYSMQFNQKIENIDCSHLIPEIRSHKTPIELEAILTKAKLPFILDQLRQKTIVYTHYRDGIESLLYEAIAQQGWKVEFFNGDIKDGLTQFVEGDIDILIATSCIGTGVDGLQKICNRLIINCLPWTDADFKQLIGRIYRPGQRKEYVDVIIPLTFADINGKRWSWCESRWKRIQFKGSIADAAVDGRIPTGQLRSPAQAHKDAMQWFERLDKGAIYEEPDRPEIQLQLSGETQPLSLRKIGDITRMNQQINKETSEATHRRFRDNPQEWHSYHAAYADARRDWEIIPYQEAIKWCQARPNLIVGDFGCGEAFLARELKNKVHSFDHVAINNNVIACDISQVPLANSSLDAAIFSLSLMGINFIDYLREAHRCLRLDGYLWIAESASRIKDINLFKELLHRLGFDIRGEVEEKGKFIFIEALKSGRAINEIVLSGFDYANVLN
jgi:superfamily II DNA or RNA helicase